MDAIAGFLESLTVWHWLGAGIVLLAFEVAIGTFDLLWIAMAAFITALFTLVFGSLGWQAELVVFAVAAMVLVGLGRTLFKGLRKHANTHPNLNDRTTSMIGTHGRATLAFNAGQGQVKIGDTVWPAQAADERAISAGDEIVVAGADGTTLKVTPA